MSALDPRRDRPSPGARVRAGIRVLAWTAPVALLLTFSPQIGAGAHAEAQQAAPGADESGALPAEMSMVARPVAFLSHQREISYPMEFVWPTAIRYLKVDRQYEVSEKDRDSGYVLFNFPHGSTSGTGSLEMLETTDVSGRKAVRLMVSTSNGPAHLPHTLAEGILAKLRAERGQPAPPPPSSPADPPKKDEGDKDQGGGESPQDQPWLLHPNGDE